MKSFICIDFGWVLKILFLCRFGRINILVFSYKTFVKLHVSYFMRKDTAYKTIFILFLFCPNQFFYFLENILLSQSEMDEKYRKEGLFAKGILFVEINPFECYPLSYQKKFGQRNN